MRPILSLLPCLTLLVAPLADAEAEVVLDGTVGSRGRLTLNGQDVRITPDMGATRGANLFHSFEKFGVPQGDAVTFEGPAGLNNVISRVTGPDVSQVHGTLRSAVPGAAFWLLNPNGLVVGKGATIDVPGSLHLSTADELRFEDGARFSARDIQGSTLSSAEPRAFGFLGGPMGRLTVEAATIAPPNLAMLSLTGGEVVVSGSSIQILGLLLIGAQVSAGEIPLLADGATARDGMITLRDDATVSMFLPFAGATARLEAGRILIDHAQLYGFSILTADDPGADQVGLDLATASLTIRGDGVKGQIASTAVGAGKAGYIDVTADEVVVDRGGLYSAPTVGGATGNVTIVADRILFTNSAQIGNPTIFNPTAGQGGQTTITAREQLTLSAGATINNITTSDLDARNVVLNVRDLVIDNADISTASIGGSGAAGSVVVNAGGKVVMIGDASISTLTANAASGGDITIAAEELSLSQGAYLITSTAGSGEAGAIQVEATDVTVGAGSRIEAESAGSGNAGAILIRAGQELRLDGGTISTGSLASSGGTVTIEVGDRIIVENGGAIVTAILGTRADERAGAITIGGPGGTKTQNLVLDATSGIAASAPNVGDGGTIRIATDGLIAQPGQIDASARQGNAGTVATTSPQTNIVSSFAGLDAQVAPADRLLATSCDAREVASSLVVGAVRGGEDAFDPRRPFGSKPQAEGCAR